jgi:hypothetical protein
MAVGLDQRARPGAVKNGRHADGRVMARVGVDRHAVRQQRLADDRVAVARDRRDQLLLPRNRHEGRRQQNARHVDADTRPLRAELTDLACQRRLDLRRRFLGNDAAIDAEPDVVRDHVGVDAAFDQPHHERRRADARRRRAHGCVRFAQRVEIRKNAIRGLQRVDPLVGLRCVTGFADDLDLDMQAAVVRRRDAVGKSGRYREVRAAYSLTQQPCRANRAAHFLVVGEMQLDGAVEARTLGGRCLQRPQRERVGREIGFGYGDATPVHHAIADLGAVGVGGPALSRRHDIAVRIERDRPPAAVAECRPHHEIGAARHAVGFHGLGGNRMPLHGEPHCLEQHGGALGVRRAVARRIVRWHFHQRGEKAFGVRAMRGEKIVNRGRGQRHLWGGENCATKRESTRAPTSTSPTVTASAGW